MAEQSQVQGNSKGSPGSGEIQPLADDATPKMLAIPDLDGPSVAFGDIKHMPPYHTLPGEFQDWHRHPFCDAVSSWFYSGAKGHESGIEIKGTVFVAKPGVDHVKALRAIKAVLGSWAPKHEHKIAACGFMLHQWFDKRTA